MAFPRSPSSLATHSPNPMKTWRDYPPTDPPTHLRLMNSSELSHYKKIYDQPEIDDDDFGDFMFGLGFYMAVDDRPRWPDLVPRPELPASQSALADWPKPPPMQTHPVSQQTSTLTRAPNCTYVQPYPVATKAMKTLRVSGARAPAPATQPPTIRPTNSLASIQQEQDHQKRRDVAKSYEQGPLPRGSTASSRQRLTAARVKLCQKDSSDWHQYPNPTVPAKDASPEQAEARLTFNREHGFNQVCANCIATDREKTCDGTEECYNCKKAGARCQYSFAGHTHEECTQPSRCPQIHDKYLKFWNFKKDELFATDATPTHWRWPPGVDARVYWPSKDKVHWNQQPPHGMALPHHKTANPNGYKTTYPQTWMLRALRPDFLATNEGYAQGHREFWSRRNDDVDILAARPDTERAATEPKDVKLRGRTYNMQEVPTRYQHIYDSVDDLKQRNRQLYDDICWERLKAENAAAVDKAEQEGRRFKFSSLKQDDPGHGANADLDTPRGAGADDTPSPHSPPPAPPMPRPPAPKPKPVEASYDSKYDGFDINCV